SRADPVPRRLGSKTAGTLLRLSDCLRRVRVAREQRRVDGHPRDGNDDAASVLDRAAAGNAVDGRPRGCAVLGADDPELVVPAWTMGWLWRLGVLPEASVALIDFNRAYVATGFSATGYALEFSKAVWLRMKTDPLWAAGAVGSLLALWDLLRTRRLDPLPALAIAWGGAAALVIVANGARLFNTYFIQTFAPLAILAAWTLAGAARQSLVHKAVATAAIALAVWLIVRHQYVPTVYQFARADVEQLRGR